MRNEGSQAIDDLEHSRPSRPGAAFLASIVKEVHSLSDILDDDDSGSEQNETSPSPGEPTLVLCHPQSLYAIPEEPNEVFSLDLCTYYIERVEPMVKLFHVPSLRAMLQSQAPYLGKAWNAPCNKAIRCAVHFAAISAMNADELRKRYGMMGASMLRRLRAALDLAIARTDVLNSSELGSLQAFALCVVSLPQPKEITTSFITGFESV